MNFDLRKSQPPLPVRHPRQWRLILYWLPVAVFCGAILIESSMPTSGEPRVFHHEDKLQHLAACAVLAWLFARALAGWRPALPSKTLKWATIAFVALFGLGNEVFQYFIPTRTASPADLAADICGGVLGAWFYLDILRGRK